MDDVNYFGRNVLYSSKEPKDLNKDTIKEILEQTYGKNIENSNQIQYLYEYNNGNQPILYKVKKVRPNINNKVLINCSHFLTEFKKGYIYGEPIQYVQRKDSNEEEISELNSIMLATDKLAKDQQMEEWRCVCGTSYRYVSENKSEDEDDEDIPIVHEVLDPRRTFVVYNSGIGFKPLLAGTFSYFSEQVMDEKGLPTEVSYEIYSIYTETTYYEFKCVAGAFEYIKEYPLATKGIRIIEYPLNQSRVGFVELTMSLMNAINKSASGDSDDIDQFVQSLLVFINQDVDPEEFQKMLEMGAILLKSSQNLPADLKQLVNTMDRNQNKVFRDDLFSYLLTIWGVPTPTNTGTSGDTGQARMLGDGWTYAEQMGNQDELSFTSSERHFLKMVVKLCKENTKSLIKTLKTRDIEIKFTRNKSNNLLVKTQGLMNMMSAKVSPYLAFDICGLFPDPYDAVSKSIEYYGEDFWKTEEVKGAMDTTDNEGNLANDFADVNRQKGSTSNKEDVKNRKTNNSIPDDVSLNPNNTGY